MKSPIGNLLRAASRQKDERYNCLSFETHERVETNLSHCNINTYAYGIEGLKVWNRYQTPVPSHYHILNRNKKEQQLLEHVDFDFGLSQSIQQAQVMGQLSKVLHINFVHWEHTLPMPDWNRDTILQIKQLTNPASIKVFITEFSRDKWLYNENEALVIRHAVDTNLFKPNNELERNNTILTVANAYPDREWCLNFSLYKKLTKGLPTNPVGDSPGFSKPANGVDDLVNKYQTSKIFLNTANFSPIPCSLLEAAACECAIVTAATSEIPYYIKDGESGIVSNDEKKLRKGLETLLKDNDMAKELGKNARKAIVEKCEMSRFVNEWNEVFDKVANIPYLG